MLIRLPIPPSRPASLCPQLVSEGAVDGSLEAILGSMHAVAEGVRTAKAALGLAQRHHIEMPIVQEVHNVLFSGKSCRQAVGDLMERDAKDEKNPA